jgi:two-component system, cell cycle sensor histidine kinase and response regulator CckA
VNRTLSPTGADSQTAPPPAPHEPETLRILLLDGNAAQADLVRASLATAASGVFSLDWVRDVATAEQRLAQHRFDVAVLDLGPVRPPATHGDPLHALRVLAPRFPDVAIVVLTHLDDNEHASEAVRLGAQDCIPRFLVTAHILERVLRYAAYRKRLEGELRTSQEQLRQAQKMDAMGRLAGGIAHDFNNKLSTILFAGALAMRKLDSDHPALRELDTIVRAAETSAGLTRQILAFGRKQVLAPRTIDVSSQIDEAHRMLQRLLGETIDLELERATTPCWVQADPTQMEQVILNLVINARDAMPAGGTIRLITDSLDWDPVERRTHPEVPAGRYCRLRAVDTGTGMTAETLARVFEPFFTTKEVGRGTGLGLSTVHGIVLQSGGHIWVESACGRGSTFTILLPAVDAPPPVAAATTAGYRAPGGTECLLVVEDESSFRALVKSALTQLGYTVFDASCGPEALEIVNARGGALHALVTDVVMPGMNGRDLARAVRALCPSIRVLYMSGYTDQYLAGADSIDTGDLFLQKPVTHGVLAHTVRRLLDGR